MTPQSNEQHPQAPTGWCIQHLTASRSSLMLSVMTWSQEEKKNHWQLTGTSIHAWLHSLMYMYAIYFVSTCFHITQELHSIFLYLQSAGKIHGRNRKWITSCDQTIDPEHSIIYCHFHCLHSPINHIYAVHKKSNLIRGTSASLPKNTIAPFSPAIHFFAFACVLTLVCFV